MALRKPIPLLFKVVISSTLAVILFRSADVHDTFRAVLRLPPGVFAAAAFIYVLGQLISAYRWKLLSDAAGFCTPLRSHISYYFIGMFFNLFLPTSIGGDGIKCWYLSRHDPSGRKAPAIYTVLAERVTGFIVMFWTGTLALFLVPGNRFPLFTYGLAAAGTGLSILVSPFIPKLLTPFSKTGTWTASMAHDISVFWRRPDAVLSALAWSFVFHCLLIVNHIIIGNAMGLQVSAVYYAVAYSASSLAGFIPISVSGVGPREGTYLYLFTLIGVGRPEALAFAVCWLGIIVVASLPGVALYLREGKRSNEARER